MGRLFTLFCFLLLTACGGGGGGGGGSPAGGSGISGVAATGAGIAGRVYLKDAAGNQQFVDTTDGSFSFSTAGLTPPYMLKVDWSVSGTPHTLYSFSSGNGTANITPLSDLVVTAAANGTPLATLYASPSVNAFNNLATALPNCITQLQQSLAPLMATHSVSGANPISTPFQPDHTGLDALLDAITVSYVAGNVTIASQSTGATIFQAPSNNLAAATVVPSWTTQDANVTSDPDIAVNAQGVGLVVWSEKISNQYFIRARLLDGSSAAVTVSSTGDSNLPRVGLDSAGNAIVVWAQYANARNEIWSSRFTAGSASWSTPQRLSAANAVADASVPDVAVDANGNAVASWYQGDGRNNHFDAWYARLNSGTGIWSAPALVSDGVNSAFDARVAVNSNGQGMLVWEQEQGDGTTVSNGPRDIWARSIHSATGALGSSVKINAVAGNIDDVYGQVAVAMDANGNGMALWVQRAGASPYVIQAARYAASGSWGASAVITHNVLDNNYGPRFGFDASGNAIAVWQQQTGVGAYGGYNRYVAGVGWGTSGQFVDESLGDVYDPRIAVNGNGNATAVWYQWNISTPGASIDVRSNRFLNGSWGTPQLLGSTGTDGYMTYPAPRIGGNAAGQMVAIWGVNSY
ncbi:MAG: hypothetical protein QM776_15035 [Rhodocyclaceae bacterium]